MRWIVAIDHPRKEALYRLIRDDPFISQQALAERLGLPRSAVVSHISDLIRERRLVGRAYVFPDRRAILCIGGASLDRKLRTLHPLQMNTSNPVVSRDTFGGVARNIAENLARLGMPVGLLTAIGDDAAGEALLTHAESVGIDTRGFLRSAGTASGSYTVVLNAEGEMVLALAQMEACDALTPEFLAGHKTQRAGAALVVADLNLPHESIRMLLAEARHEAIPLVIVAVSQPKMSRLPADLAGLRLLILNAGELESLAGRTLATVDDIAHACDMLRQQGAQDVIVTRGAFGVIHTTDDEVAVLPAPQVTVTDVTGAGDAFAAGVCWSFYHEQHDLALACRRGMALAALTMQSDTTVCPTLSAGSLQI
jgi:pseudouridine kinase